MMHFYFIEVIIINTMTVQEDRIHGKLVMTAIVITTIQLVCLSFIVIMINLWLDILILSQGRATKRSKIKHTTCALWEKSLLFFRFFFV